MKLEGGLILYVREDVPSTLLKIDSEIEAFYIELNIRKKKSLLCCSYNAKKNHITKHLAEIGKNLDIFSSKYDNFIILGDLNSEPCEQPILDFCHVYNCQNIIKDKTCFKNPQNPPCIDLIITDRQISFQNSTVIETGSSDFLKMSLSIMKVFCKKERPNIIRYHNYRNFNNECFVNDVQSSILREYSQNETLEYELFKRKVDYVLEKHAPIKKRYVRANQAPFIDKTINKL